MNVMRLLTIVLLLQGFSLGHEGHEPLPAKGATVKGDRLTLSASAAKAIGLQTTKVELAAVQRMIRAVGSVELPWSQQAFASTLIAGRVENVLVKPGETVQAGQQLATVAGAELENLQLTLVQAAKERSLAVRVLHSQEAAGQGIAEKVLLQARTEVQQQSARFNVAWQKLKAIGLADETLRHICDTGETVPAIGVVSPIGGVVSAADVRAGQIVQPTDHLYHIVDPSRVWIVGKVLETDASRVKRGMNVEVTFATLPDQVFRAAIDHIELRLNKDRTLSVKAILDNQRGLLKPGMFGRLDIQVGAEKAVVCPAEALIRDGGSSDVLVEDSSRTYLRKPVVVAAVHRGRAEIDDGLFPGDKVVTVGSHELAALFADRAPPRHTVNAKPRVGATAQGQVELPTDQKAFASAPIEGQLRRILVEHGQSVQKGDILAELDSLPFRTLQLDLLQARSSLTQSTQNLARAKALGDSLPHKDLWQLQTQRDTIEQTINSLHRQLALLGLSPDELAKLDKADLNEPAGSLFPVLPVRAPADGLIGDFDLVPGQAVARQDQLFELHNPAMVWIRAYVFEQDAARIRVGQPVRLGLVSDPAFQASGTIDRIDPILVSGNRALAIWTEIDNKNLQFKEGMAAIVTLDTPSVAER
jgi:membrane fusion protein, heavy metal efflux system